MFASLHGRRVGIIGGPLFALVALLAYLVWALVVGCLAIVYGFVWCAVAVVRTCRNAPHAEA